MTFKLHAITSCSY